MHRRPNGRRLARPSSAFAGRLPTSRAGLLSDSAMVRRINTAVVAELLAVLYQTAWTGDPDHGSG